MPLSSSRKDTYLNRTPPAKLAGLFVSGLEHLIGQPLIDGVDSLKHAVSELNERLQAFRHGVPHNVGLPASLHSDARHRDLLQSFLQNNTKITLQIIQLTTLSMLASYVLSSIEQILKKILFIFKVSAFEAESLVLF